jgi:CrcB protein
VNRKDDRPADLWAGVRRRGGRAPVQWGPPDVVGVIALGGALGAVARWAAGTVWPHPAGTFPWSVFVVNVTGCLAIGVLLVLLTEVAGRPHRLARPFLGTGVLGGYTTFSTYAVEAERLLASGRAALALAYLFGTLAAALLAAQAGVSMTRALARRRSPEGEPA